MSRPLFERDGDRFIATDLTAGPWAPEHGHGGATSALLAHVVDRIGSLVSTITVRLTVELLRPVARTPLTIRTQILREGRRVQLVGAALVDDSDVEVASTTALRIRRDELALPVPSSPAPRVTATGPDDLPRFAGNEVWRAGFFDAVELRLPEGALGTPGATSGWVRLAVPVVDDEPITPLSRVAAAADFGNGISAPLPMDRYLFINPDLTIALDRVPADDWVGISSHSSAQPTGVGRTVTELRDRDGPIGTALQSLYVAAR